MTSILILLQLAVSLLSSIQQNPLLGQSFKDQAISVANQAIQMANSALNQSTTEDLLAGASTTPPIVIPTVITPERIIDLNIVDYSQSNDRPKFKVKFSDSGAGTFLEKQLILKLQILNPQLSSVGKEYVIYDSSKDISEGISNPFISSDYSPYFSSRDFPKNKEDSQRYFIIAFYDGNFYRTTLASYFNFEPIPECDQIIAKFRNDPTTIYLKKALNNYSNEYNDLNKSWERINNSYSESFNNNSCSDSFIYIGLSTLTGIFNNP